MSTNLVIDSLVKTISGENVVDNLNSLTTAQNYKILKQFSLDVISDDTYFDLPYLPIAQDGLVFFYADTAIDFKITDLSDVDKFEVSNCSFYCMKVNLNEYKFKVKNNTSNTVNIIFYLAGFTGEQIVP